MAAVANNPKFAKKAGVPQSVGEEFLKADKGRKFKDGGVVKPDEDIAKSVKDVGRVMYDRWLREQSEKPQMTSTPKKAPSNEQTFFTSSPEDKKFLSKRNDFVVNKAAGGKMESKKMVGKEIAFMKKKGAPKSMIKHEMAEAKGMKKMASGGLAAGHRQADGVAQRGKTRGMEIKMAAGGLAAGHKQADGIAKKGKTRGMEVKMSKGGKAMGGKC
jgi:hypothetical protein